MIPPRGDQRFPRSCHLRHTSDFSRNRREGVRSRSKHFVVCVSPGPGAGWRLGLVVSRRVGGAVERNRVKRLVREVFRLNSERVMTGKDLVVIARPGAADLGYEETREEILACLDSHTGTADRG